MQITIMMTGKVREPYIKEGISVYLRRLSPVHRIRIIELPAESISGKSSPAMEERNKNIEGTRLLEHSEGAGTRIALDAGGEVWTSQELALHMKSIEVAGSGPVVFMIGGSLGLAPSVLNGADRVLSLSRLTFPHQLVPLLLLEQIYRADCMNRNVPYHK
jgi:23S rRNA (pseudouridine1915-N3)-methyltransferase